MESLGPHVNGLYDIEDQLSTYIRKRAEARLDKADREKASLDSPASFAARLQSLHDQVLTSIGGLPELSKSVSATVTGTLGGKGFTIEKVLIETVPGVHATANLYLPDAPTPAPGILFLCGHAREAKAYPRYQKVCRALVRAGMAVLALDPVGQGERVQYLDPKTGEEIVRWGTTEHSHAGFQCHIAGFNVARYFIADAMQALTYLASRPEVDAAKLGVTGNSGGGTQTSYLTFFDRRLTCSAPCTYITSRRAYMATGQPHDSEQNFYRAIAMGLDYDDLLAPHAPKPLLIGAVASDFFTVEGCIQSYTHLNRAYGLYGREKDLYLVIGPGRHGYSDLLRDRAVRFFSRHLLEEEVELPSGMSCYAEADEAPGDRLPMPPVAEEETLDPESLNVTEEGQVMLAKPQARRVFDLNLEAWHARSDAAKAMGDGRQRRRKKLAETIFGEREASPLWVRELRTGKDEASGINWAHRFTFSEPGMALPMAELWSDGVEGAERLWVVATDLGTEAISERRQEVVAWVKEYRRVLLVDPRGIGAARQRPVNGRGGDQLYGTFYKLNSDAMMLGDSLFAMRAYDFCRALEYAHRVASEVSVRGEGVAGLELLTAAFLDGGVDDGEFLDLVDSYEGLVKDRYFQADLTLEVFDLLSLPDVPEMLKAIPNATVRSTTAPGDAHSA